MAAALGSLVRDLPPDVQRVLEDVVAAARESFAEHLVSVVLYGSAAEGALLATSDVNVVFVLAAFDPGRADRIRDAIRAAEAAVQLRSMFLLEREVGAATTAFA